MIPQQAGLLSYGRRVPTAETPFPCPEPRGRPSPFAQAGLRFRVVRGMALKVDFGGLWNAELACCRFHGQRVKLAERRP